MRTGTAPLPVEALLTTAYISAVARSNRGDKLAYISDAAGRPNLWIMNVDGSGAQQLTHSDDRQASPRFTHDDTQVVYSQDRGGNECYDIYVVPVSGGEPRNLTNTADVSESVREFSPDSNVPRRRGAPATVTAGHRHQAENFALHEPRGDGMARRRHSPAHA